MTTNHRSQAFVVVGCVFLTSISLLTATASAENRVEGPVNVRGETNTEQPANAITTPAVPANPAKSDAAAARKADAKALERRAGERIGENPQGRSLVLGMELQEGDNGRPRIVGVGVATPAYDAGIKKGDEIVAYQNFSANSYRRWIDGIRRLTSDVPGNSQIRIVVLRDGKRIPITVRVPETRVAVVPPPVAAQQTNNLLGPPGQPLAGQPMPVAAGPANIASAGGNSVLIDNGAPAGDIASSANERAMAQIFRLNGPTTTNTTGTDARNAATHPGTPANATAAGGTRIGLAGFRDDPSGMVVTIDVGALPPGNYLVGIGDPSIGGGITGTGVEPSTNPKLQTPSGSTPADIAPPAGASGSAPAGASEPQSNLAPQSSTSSGTVSPSTGTTIPPTGQTRPLTAPPTGHVPLTAPPTGEVNPRTAPPSQPGASSGTSIVVNGIPHTEVGTITVDQSGTGRLQQTVETARVRDVVGQAIVLYSQGNTTQPILPSNLNGSAGTASRQGVVDSTSAPKSPNAVAAGQPTAGTQPTAEGQQIGPRMPIAAGIIRLISDRRPGGTNSGVAEPTTATPKTGQGLVR